MEPSVGCRRRRLASATSVVVPKREAIVDQIGLVERARRGDRHAFAELARASGARLDATARLILRDPELAQDAVQETLIRAWRSLPGLREPRRSTTGSTASWCAPASTSSVAAGGA